jgi:hypothetical protein
MNTVLFEYTPLQSEAELEDAVKVTTAIAELTTLRDTDIHAEAFDIEWAERPALRRALRSCEKLLHYAKVYAKDDTEYKQMLIPLFRYSIETLASETVDTKNFCQENAVDVVGDELPHFQKRWALQSALAYSDCLLGMGDAQDSSAAATPSTTASLDIESERHYAIAIHREYSVLTDPTTKERLSLHAQPLNVCNLDTRPDGEVYRGRAEEAFDLVAEKMSEKLTIDQKVQIRVFDTVLIHCTHTLYIILTLYSYSILIGADQGIRQASSRPHQ